MPMMALRGVRNSWLTLARKSDLAWLASSACCRAADMHTIANYDFKNPSALKRLAQSGAQLRPFPEDVMMAAFDASRQVFDEISAENADFKRQWEAMKPFISDWYLYSQTTDYTFDTMMMIQQRNGKL